MILIYLRAHLKILKTNFNRNLSQQPGTFLVARFLVCNVAHIPIAHGRLYHTPRHTGKERPEQQLSFANVPEFQYGRTPT
jgi:hypothetical protein